MPRAGFPLVVRCKIVNRAQLVSISAKLTWMLPMTRAQIALPATLLLVLGACTEPGTDGAAPIYSTNLPEKVKEIADPTQDLSKAYFRVEDGCYWYRYDGPVEVTDLPLRTTGGAPICTRPREVAETAAAG